MATAEAGGVTQRLVVVTGASRGVGRAIAEAFVEAGDRVVSVSRSGVGVGNALAADLRSPDEIDRVATLIRDSWGDPSVLVNAAGLYGPICSVADSDPTTWIDTLSVNLVAAYLTSRAFTPGMISAGWGRIVNLTSAASLHPPSPLNSAYATSKVALNHFTRSLATELQGTGVTANVLHPGDLRTDMWRDIDRQAAAAGPAGEGYRQWARWVEETGGDPPEKAAQAVMRIVSGTTNGVFHWIEEPLQAPIPSWGDVADERPWTDDAPEPG